MAALTGWLFGPFVLLLLFAAWADLLLIINGHLALTGPVRAETFREPIGHGHRAIRGWAEFAPYQYVDARGGAQERPTAQPVCPLPAQVQQLRSAPSGFAEYDAQLVAARASMVAGPPVELRGVPHIDRQSAFGLLEFFGAADHLVGRGRSARPRTRRCSPAP
ncbi:hypothetical protein [Rugosimonospora acidiphila]|uniref:hypothetical protein n=1 Tax=Rugosimonospora acidiphila TaxID=556531 RepID=UPI0031ED549B